jgi:hypothetical protein
MTRSTSVSAEMPLGAAATIAGLTLCFQGSQAGPSASVPPNFARATVEISANLQSNQMSDWAKAVGEWAGLIVGLAAVVGIIGGVARWALRTARSAKSRSRCGRRAQYPVRTSYRAAAVCPWASTTALATLASSISTIPAPAATAQPAGASTS